MYPNFLTTFAILSRLIQRKCLIKFVFLVHDFLEIFAYLKYLIVGPVGPIYVVDFDNIASVNFEF
jgi:hypothetical protein